MSSRRSSSRRGGGGGGSNYYPTQWSEWEWNPQYRCHQRYRLKGPDEYEYDYGPVQTEDTPRTNPPLDPIEQPAQYTAQVSYTTTPATDVDRITSGLAHATLGPSTSLLPQVPYTQSSQSGPNYITTRNPNTLSEEFDPHYKVHGGWEFKWGRVFKVLWTEPKGNDGHGSNGGSSAGATISERTGRYGEVHHEKVRRFVIINAMEGHCICLPIMTYGGQGVNKRGVHAKHHTIIYSSSKPTAFKGEKEKGLTKKPIRVDPAGPRHKLDSASRLNYAKPYTVEYNVKVWFIGKVHPRSEWQLGTDYNRVHPPLETRGVPEDDVSEDTAVDHAQGGSYQGYYSSATYGSGSSYPAPTAYSVSYGAGAIQSPYGSPVSGAGAGFSSASYQGHHSLDPVGEEAVSSTDYDLPFSHGHGAPPDADFQGPEVTVESEERHSPNDNNPDNIDDLYGAQ